MTHSKKALPLLTGQARVYGRHVGQVRNIRIDRRVGKAAHETNYGLEFKTDHVIAIRTAYSVGFTFEEIQPANANLMLGAPGYGMVPVDRTMPGLRRTPAMLAYGTTRRQFTETAQLYLDDVHSLGVLNELMYPIVPQNSAAISAPEIAVINNDFTGTIVGYYAVVVSGSGAARANESLPSNIEIVPYSSVEDTFTITYKHGTVQGTHWNVYLSTMKPKSGVGHSFLGGFKLMDNFTSIIWGGLTEVTNADGTITLIGDGEAVDPVTLEFDPAGDGAVGVGVPVTPIDVLYYHATTGALTSAVWCVDFHYDGAYKGGSMVKIAKGSELLASGQPVEIVYWYDVLTMRELPLDASGRSPVVPMTFEYLFPDQESKIIWHFYRVQINSDLSFAANEGDWSGMDFQGETLDATDLYPNYGFGYMQIMGPLAAEIKEFGNIPWNGEYEALSDNQTSYA